MGHLKDIEEHSWVEAEPAEGAEAEDVAVEIQVVA